MKLSARHILSIDDLTKKDVLLVLSTAASFKEISERSIKKVPTLRGRTVINAFFEDSTRTRLSFEIAEKRLSADTVNISTSGSAMAKKGETLLDTVRNLEAMRPDILVIRHHASGAPGAIARATRAHVINAGDGLHEHPTQALLDLFTIQQAKGRLSNLTVGIVGDILHSRVARSNMMLFKKMGIRCLVGGPPTLIPLGLTELYEATICPDLREAMPRLDVLMVLRVQRERLEGHFFPSLREYARHFGVSADLVHTGKPDLIIMHPGPVNRGVELAPEVADGAQSVILDQVTNGVAVRMALLYLLIGDGEGS